MSLTPEDRALIEAGRKNGRVMSLDDGVFTCSAGGLAALLAAAREQPRQPPEDVREKVEKAVRDAVTAVLAREYTPAFAGSIAGFERRRENKAKAIKEATDAVLPLLALPAVAVGDGWRPIETAPKDGTLILAGYRGHDVALVVGWQSDPDVTGWVTGETNNDGYCVTFDVDCWQPLPAPPHGGGG